MISGSVMVVEGAPECWNVDVSNWVTLALGDVSWRLFAALTIVVYSAHFLYIADFPVFVHGQVEDYLSGLESL